jgi:hypothetical protein
MFDRSKTFIVNFMWLKSPKQFFIVRILAVHHLKKGFKILHIRINSWLKIGFEIIKTLVVNIKLPISDSGHKLIVGYDSISEFNENVFV